MALHFHTFALLVFYLGTNTSPDDAFENQEN